ncbi:MAG TPA: DUF4397 domain-containing protein [Gemmatimonadales bacterium]|nr:DUF4397 domain-containing protein [Gemmatimonadales bacterium]
MNSVARLALALLPFATLACSNNDIIPFDPNTEAQIRFIHAVPEGPNLDLLIEGAAAARNVAFDQAVGYFIIAAGQRSVSARESAVGEEGTPGPTVFTLTPTLTAGTFYTIIATGAPTAVQTIELVDNPAKPAAGNWNLRLVNAAPNLAAIDIYITEPNVDLHTVSPTIANVAYGGGSNYVTLPVLSAGQVIRITNAGDKDTPLIVSTERTFVSQQVSTIFVLGNPNGAPFALFLADGTGQ